MKNIFFRYFKYFLLLSLLYMPIFGHLDTLPIRQWDESRQAINAYEMLNSGDFIVTHFNGHPDMWNTKPPLLVWLQVLFMKVLGVNELAVRLPSAIAAFFTAMALLFFSTCYLKRFWLGFIAALVLITSQGYIGFHASRTGDYDALLTFFTTLGCLSFFTFCETKKYKWLYLFFACTTLAVLTKSVAGLLFLPAIFIYAIIQKQVIPLLKNKHFYLGFTFFLFFVIGYYALREANNTGYIAAVQKNELGGRYLGEIEDHGGSFWFYYENLVDSRLSIWSFLIPCGILIGLVIKKRKIKKLTLFLALMVTTFFLIISMGQTKMDWYDVPLFPFLSVLIATFIYYVFEFLNEVEWVRKTLSVNLAPFIFLFLIFMGPYQKILDKTYKPKEYGWSKDFYEIGYYLKAAIKGKYNLNGHYLLFDGYGAQNMFYLNILNDKGIEIHFKDWKKLEPGDIVITCQKNIDQYLKENYDYRLLSLEESIATYEIFKRKNT